MQIESPVFSPPTPAPSQGSPVPTQDYAFAAASTASSSSATLESSLYTAELAASEYPRERAHSEDDMKPFPHSDLASDPRPRSAGHPGTPPSASGLVMDGFHPNHPSQEQQHHHQQQQQTSQHPQQNGDEQLQYSELGRQIVAGGENVPRVLSAFSFGGGTEYHDLAGQGHHAYPPPPPHPSSQFQAVNETYRVPGTHHHHQQHLHPAHPPVQWQEQYLQHVGMSSSQSQQAMRVGYSISGQQRLAPGPAHTFYAPYQPAGSLMVRTASGGTSSTSSAYSDSEGYSYPSSSHDNSGSDYESTGVCNPAYISQAQHHHLTASAPSSMPDSPSSVGGGGGSGSGSVGGSASGSFYLADVARYSSLSRSTNDLDALRLGDSPDGLATVRQRCFGSTTTSTTLRGASTSATTTSSSPPKRSTRTTATAIFHPSPASMLAPAVASARRAGKLPTFPGTDSPGFPTDDDFARMPTKRSRGRRPPCSPELLLSADPNANPSQAQLRYCGVTKTGKPRKIFLCKVPLCGKCFRRSEHLKRHVRSIHTNEKPFQCQWPACGKFFSRHDNLNQHLRIHRAPGQSDASFSAMLEACFGGKTLQQQEQQPQQGSEEDEDEEGSGSDY